MQAVQAWRNFWFRPAPYFDLAFLRILIVAFQCFILLAEGFNQAIYTNALPDESYKPIVVLQLLLPFTHARPDGDVVMAVYWITLGFGLCALVGLRTNITLLVFAVANIFLQAYMWSFEDYHHREAIMMIALLALAFGPSGRVLSVDALLEQRRRGAASSVPLLDFNGVYAWWPIRLLQLFFPLMYLSAMLGKLTRSGFEWANGYTLQYYMIMDYYRNGSELSLWTAQHHALVQFGQVMVLLFQATFFLIAFFPRLRWFYLPIGLAFHIGIYLTLRAPFPQWMLLYAIYIPWAAAFKWAASARVSTATVAPAT